MFSFRVSGFAFILCLLNGSGDAQQFKQEEISKTTSRAGNKMI
jgi:hypothetical protein